ncbi:MazF family transcriptional regulator [Candidatus Fermentibacteria bacterium]|nr:MAG: MazF family transcriptional regulator [Candidatus Fermentibacteria bacterium]
MGALTAGSIVLVTFPFSDLSNSKLRPAVVLASVHRGDWILCQITSNPYADSHAVQLSETDFHSGSLQRVSYARPGKLFTANTTLIRMEVGNLKQVAFQNVLKSVINILNG